MRAWIALVLPASIALAIGCTPSPNATPGHYTCGTPADCPAISPYCVAMRCWPTPMPPDAGIDAATGDAGPDAGASDDAGIEDAGGGDGGPGDGGPADGGPGDGGPGDGGPRPPDGGPPPCTANGECGGGLCIAGACRRPCTTDAECGMPGVECLGADSAGTHANVCLPRSIATAGPYYQACGAGCPAPFACIEGHCLRSCDPSPLCLPEESCVRSAPIEMGGEMRLVCVELCGDGTCPGEGRCAPPPPGSGGTTNVCIVWGGPP